MTISFDLMNTIISPPNIQSILKKYTSKEYQTYFHILNNNNYKICRDIALTNNFQNYYEYFEEVEKTIHINEYSKELFIKVVEEYINLCTIYTDFSVIFSLNSHHEIYLISNLPFFFGKLIEKFHLKRYFKQCILSFEVSYLKPQNEIFLLANNLTIHCGDDLKSDCNIKNDYIHTVLIDRKNQFKLLNILKGKGINYYHSPKILNKLLSYINLLGYDYYLSPDNNVKIINFKSHIITTLYEMEEYVRRIQKRN